MSTITHAVLLDRSEANVLGVRIQGRVQPAELTNILTPIKAAIARYGSVRLLLELKSLKGITPGAFWEELGFPPSLLSCVDRLALVGDEDWSTLLAEPEAPRIGLGLRMFEPIDLRAAWEWVSADQRTSISTGN